MESFYTFLVCLCQVVSVSSLSITTPGDVLAGRPFTLECKITRSAGDRNRTAWYKNKSVIYLSRDCNTSIPVLSAGLSGGCQHVNGEEVYTVTIQNVTEDTGRVTWICLYKGQNINVTLDVKVPVTRVTLTNPPHTVLAGKPTNLTCVTSASKPQACIRAYIRSSGNVRELDPHACNQDSILVQTTTRTLTSTARAEENGAELYCIASNRVTDPPVQSQVYTLNVQYPPQSGVRLSGYANNTAVESGQKLTLTCQVGKGNPKPALSWSSGCGQTNTIPGNDGSQQISISITVSPSLNQKTCVCKGSQEGAMTRWMEQKSRTFNVLFGPDSIQLRADFGQSGNTVTVTENSNVTFTCNTSESNPAAVLFWNINSRPIAAAEISQVSSPPGRNHGYLTTQRYKVRVDRYQDGDVIRCGARRSGIRSSKRVSSNLTLDVRYRPCPPTLTSVLCENHMANVTWISCFNGGSTQTFKLQYKKKGGNWVELLKDITDPGEDLTVSEVVGGLEEGVQYSFRVYGVNRWNKSDTTDTNCTVAVSAIATVCSPSSLVGVIAGVSTTAALLVIAVIIITILLIMKRRKKSGTDTTQSQGQRTLPNHQEMTEVHTNARVYQTLNLSSSSPEIPIYVNSVPSTEYENTFTLTTENDSTDPAYERLQTNPAPIVDTNRLYENTRLT